MVVAGALKVFAVFVAVGALLGVGLFRAELLKLVPFVGATGPVAPAIFTAMVVGVALLFWGLADALVMLAANADAHERLEIAIRDRSAPTKPTAVAPETTKAAGVGDVPGFKRYQRPLPRMLKWTASVTNGPALLATTVCEVVAGEPVTALGELAEFVFVETAGGSGWLPKDALGERAVA